MQYSLRALLLFATFVPLLVAVIAYLDPPDRVPFLAAAAVVGGSGAAVAKVTGSWKAALLISLLTAVLLCAMLAVWLMYQLAKE